jgi:hypothetical protein
MHGTILPGQCTYIPIPIRWKDGPYMDPHAHISPIHMLAFLAATVAIMGTVHLLAIGSDSRASRAYLALGF